MKTININTYTFDELSKEVQERLIEKRVKANEEFYCEDFLEEDIKEQAARTLKTHFKKYNDSWLNGIYFDLSFCQGDFLTLELEGEYCGKPFKVEPRKYSFYLDYDGTNKTYEHLKDKIEAVAAELKNYGYSCIRWYWSDAAESEAAEQLREEGKYLSDGTPVDSLPID